MHTWMQNHFGLSWGFMGGLFEALFPSACLRLVLWKGSSLAVWPTYQSEGCSLQTSRLDEARGPIFLTLLEVWSMLSFRGRKRLIDKVTLLIWSQKNVIMGKCMSGCSSLSFSPHHASSKLKARDFRGGSVVKNPPSNAGHAGLIPGRGTKIPRAAGQLSPCTTTTELARLS